MKIKEWLFNFFHFNKQERNGIFILCLIILFLFIIKLFIPVLAGDKSEIQLITVQLKNEKAEDPASNNQQAISSNEQQSLHKTVVLDLFVFNPNTITLNDAQRLGFTDKLSHTLINFRNKGGKFYKAEDLKKLYGMPQALYDRLEPYILIPGNSKTKDTTSNFVSKNFFKEKSRPKAMVDLNAADSLSLVELRGIGPAFTKRILKYRKLLGGFHSMVQLKEVYGMNDSLYNTLASQSLINAQNINKIPINVIDANSLRAHPYINYQAAHAIINYRNKHGKLTASSIKEVGVFTEEKLSMLMPYLTF